VCVYIVFAFAHSPGALRHYMDCRQLTERYSQCHRLSDTRYSAKCTGSTQRVWGR